MNTSGTEMCRDPDCFQVWVLKPYEEVEPGVDHGAVAEHAGGDELGKRASCDRCIVDGGGEGVMRARRRGQGHKLSI
jgi:hypothetical protein